MKIAILIIGSLVTAITDSTTTESYTACGDTSYSDSHGVISSPNYPGDYYNNLYCDYYVYAPPGSSLSFVFNSFHVDQSDSVIISCPPNSNFPPQEYSGHFLPAPVSIPVCSQGRVNFRTDYTNVSSGFSIYYYVNDAGCGNAIYAGSNGYVNSPNWPDYYGYNQNCSNIIWATEQSTIQLNFHSFNLQDNCSADWLEISCLDNSGYGPTRYCGNYNSYNLYIHQCSQVLLSFHSDGSDNYQGFSIEYTIYPVGDTTSLAGTMDTTYPATNTTPQPVCGYTSYYGPSGVIISPNYPFLYNRDLDCYYYVHASTDSSISFIFKAFNTEENFFDYVNISCVTNSSLPYRRFSGHVLPEPVSLPWCSLGVVHFHSDVVNVDTGFSLTYYVSEGGCGNTVYNESYGFVTSPNWPSAYGYDHSCLNIIWAPKRSTFNLLFQSFSLNSCCSCDWLEIRCLDNSDYGPYKYCGRNSLNSLHIYQCSQALLWFHSDSSSNDEGFNIRYSFYLVGGCNGDVYNGPFGLITSPNYPDNYYNSLECQYYIVASTGSSIAIIFEHFDVQVDKDFLAISCETNSSFPEQRYSGHTLPPELKIPWCSQGSLFFLTDAYESFSGFSIRYLVNDEGCGDTMHSSSGGNVKSPNYPSFYDENQDCYYTLSAPQPGHHYHLEYIDFAVQGSDQCSLDWVEISCLDDNPSNKHRFCGDIVYSLDFYRCTEVLVWFHSDGAVNYKGFNLKYNIDLVSGCGEEAHYGPSGVITSPNFPAFYNNSLFCGYNIYTSSSSSSIAIIFSTFFTEQCCDYVTISCPTNESYSPMTLSGLIQSPPPVSIPWCSHGNVNFGTDITTGAPGFSLEYYVSTGGCGDTVYAEMPGIVSSPNYPGVYSDNQNCSNIIYIDGAITFEINFLHMNVEECCDFVELSCLDNPAYGTHRFSGNVIPPTQTIPDCTKVLVWFYTDYTTVLDGFSLQYSTAAASGLTTDTRS